MAPSAFEQEVFRVLNEARTNPVGFIQHLEAMKDCFTGKRFKRPGSITLVTVEGTDAVDDAIEYLRSHEPVAPLQRLSPGMSQACAVLVQDNGPRGVIGHKGKDGADTFARLDRFGKWKIKAGENICYGASSAIDVVLQWVVDDGIKTRPHRESVFDKTFEVVGISAGLHSKYRKMCVAAFAKEYVEGAAEGAEADARSRDVDLEDAEDGSAFLIRADFPDSHASQFALVVKAGNMVSLEQTKREGTVTKQLCKSWTLPFSFAPDAVRAWHHNATGQLVISVDKPQPEAKHAQKAIVASFDIPASAGGAEKVTLDIEQTNDFFLVRTVPTCFHEQVVTEIEGDVLRFNCTHTEETVADGRTKRLVKEFVRHVKLPYQVAPSMITTAHIANGVELKISKPSATQDTLDPNFEAPVHIEARE